MQNVQDRRSKSSGNDYEKSNSSCLTLKPVKTAERPLSLFLPGTGGEWEAEDGFSSDVLGALGMV